MNISSGMQLLESIYYLYTYLTHSFERKWLASIHEQFFHVITQQLKHSEALGWQAFHFECTSSKYFWETVFIFDIWLNMLKIPENFVFDFIHFRVFSNFDHHFFT